MIKNTQKITSIVMKPFAECRCVLGKDWYHIDYEAEMTPADCYPDYMDVSRFISEEINGKDLNIEDAVEKFGNFLWENYSPASLTVKANVSNVTTHCPVIVIKEYQ